MTTEESKAIGGSIVGVLTDLAESLNQVMSNQNGDVDKIKLIKPDTQGFIADVVRGLLEFIELAAEKMEYITVEAYRLIVQIDAGIAMVGAIAQLIDQMPALVSTTKNELEKIDSLSHLVSNLPDVSGVNLNFSDAIDFIDEKVISPVTLADLARELNQLTGAENLLSEQNTNQGGKFPELIKEIKTT